MIAEFWNLYLNFDLMPLFGETINKNFTTDAMIDNIMKMKAAFWNLNLHSDMMQYFQF